MKLENAMKAGFAAWLTLLICYLAGILAFAGLILYILYRVAVMLS